MKFEFTDTHEVAEKAITLRDLDKEAGEEYRYIACIESVSDTPLSTLANADCQLIVEKKPGDDGVWQEVESSSLPLRFDIKLRRTGQILNTFQQIAQHRLKEFEYRTRLSGKGVAQDPVDALRTLRDNRLVLHLEAERKEDGEFEPLIWGTGMEVFTEGVGTVDRPWEKEVVDKSLEARMMGRWNEFKKASSG